jgi:hypothetical protein
MLSSLVGSIIVAESQAAQAYASLDLSEEKYGITRLRMVEKENINYELIPTI